jgi:TonB-linked SusC/RagA family outer membrane protein
MKKSLTVCFWENLSGHKVLQKMKLTLIFMMAGLLQVSATVYSQNTRFSLHVRGKQVADILKQIEKESDFRFFYQREQVDVTRKVDLKAESETVEEILEQLFGGQGVVYKVMEDNLILLRPEKDMNQLNAPPQQQKTVTGKVTDASGALLPGVAVAVKGTTKGTITDAGGEFILQNVPADAILVFSFVGMRTQEIPVERRTNINVILDEETIGIEEVVAIGYGTIKKQDLTGSVATVRGDLLAERQTMKVAEALQGAMPGVTVTRSGNRPGDDPSIRIRGVTTIGDSSPLVIIDGVPGSISNINPNDIENISVLKDAASASIYGSKAAAGVILITTKRAETNQFDLNYNFEYGIDKPTTRPYYLDAAGFMKIQNELKWNDNLNTGSEYPLFTKDLIENYASLHAQNSDQYPDTDWLGLLLKDQVPRQSHLLSVTAGAEKIRTKVSIADDQTNGLYEGLSYERITVRANNNITVNKYISAAIDLNYTRLIDKEASFAGDTYLGSYASAPYAALWSDGRIAEGQTTYNPYALITFGGDMNALSNLGGGKITLDITPLTGLKISATYAPNFSTYKSKTLKKAIPYTRWNEPNNIAGYINGAKTTSLTEKRTDSFNETTQLLVNYNKKSGEHNFNLMGGYESYYSTYESEGASSDNMVLSSYPYLDLANSNYLSVNGNANEYASRSYFGRIIYDYKNKYLLQANARYDGSSRFHKDYRWGFFPSFSAGWVVSRESFLEDADKLSFLKLRASWGALGNERIGNYPYQSTMVFGKNIEFKGNIPSSAQTAAITKYAIEDISWETTESLDLGIDASFFDNRLGMTFDYYKKETRDMLLNLEIPDYIGLDNPDQNTGKMDTKGWEFDLRYNNNIGDLKYSFSFNLSDYKSEMGDLGGTEFIGNQVKFKGSEFNEWYGYRTAGLFQTQEERNNSPVLNNQVRVGDIKYVDISGVDGVPDGKITPEYDRVLLGGSLPRWLYGGNISVEYKSFDFSMVIQGVGKQNARLHPYMVYNENNDVPKYFVGKYWSHYRTAEQNLGAIYPRLSTTCWADNYNTLSDFWLFNGGYFRIKNVTLGYTIPEAFAHKILLKNARIYASMSDFLSIDKYPEGWDPETQPDTYWITSSFIMGISVNF